MDFDLDFDYVDAQTQTQPTKERKKPGPKPKGEERDIHIYNNIYNGDDINIYKNSNRADLGLPLTADPKSIDFITNMELRFLEIYLEGGISRNNAMKKAGYENMTDTWRYCMAKKIINKYDRSVPDHRKIFQAVGCGRIRVARKVHDAIDSAKNEMAQLGYVKLAAAALGITAPVQEQGQGVQIVIQAQEGSAQQINITSPGPTEPTGYDHPTPASPGKPIMITK